MFSRTGAALGAVGAALLASCSNPRDELTGAAYDGALESVAHTDRCDAPPDMSASVQLARDVPYPQPDGRTLRMDVAWSTGGGPAPLILLLHGGGWSGGSRASMHGEMHALAALGYTAAAVEYRLSQAGQNLFPAAAQDVRCALRTLRTRAADYNIAPTRAAIMGYSAGGHLASLLAVGAHVPEFDHPSCGSVEDDDRVQAVVSYAGPQDLRVNGPYTAEQAELVTNFLGAFPGDAPALATLASPIAHVRAGAPPFLLVQGVDDPLVPASHARRMRDALRQAGTPASLIELRGVGHGYVGMAASRTDSVRCTVTAFLGRWLRG